LLQEVQVQVRSFAVFVGVGLVSALAVVVLPGTSGCTFDNVNNTVDTGYVIPPDDTGSDVVADTGPAAPTVVDPVSGADIPADFSCLGKADGGVGDAMIDETAFDGGTPATGQLIPTIVDMYSFNERNRRLAGAEVELYYGNTFKNAAVADVTGLITDDAGLVTAPMPANWHVGYHVLPRDNADLSLAYVPYWELDQPVPGVPNQKMHFFGMTKEVYQSLALAIASTRDYVIPATSSIVAMRLVDCQRRNMRNVTAELQDVTDGTPKPVTLVPQKDCITGTCLIYLSDLELPSPATITSRSGLITIVGLSTAKKYHVVGHGYLNGNATADVARRDLETVGGAIAVQYAQP
jgi:hypothetical protein